jgi:hypothetical protein
MYRAVELFVPIKRLSHTKNANNKKYPKYLKRLFTRKVKLWRQWTKSRNTIDKNKYDRLAAKCKHAANAYNAECESNLVNCNDLGRFYKFVSSKLSASRNLPSLTNSEDKLIIDPSEKANIFNQYFASVFTQDNGHIPHCKAKQSSSLSDVEFSPLRVYKALKSFKPKCSFGPDGLPSILLHNTAGVISHPLSFIFDASFRTGVLPTCWR